MTKVRIGVIGVGGMGSGHCSWMPKVDEAELTAVCDIVPEVAKDAGAKFGVKSFTKAEKLLDSGLVDAVIIATPHYFHPTIAVKAFAKRIHVLSEKPIAVTVSAADAMIAAAKESGCTFGVMYQMRSMGQWKAVKQIIADGLLGDIYRTSMTIGWYRSQAYYDSGGWRATWVGEGGGVLINQAPHFLDLFAWLAGLPVRLTGGTRTRIHEIEVEDEAFATMEYANGAHGYLYASTTEAPGYEQFQICGDKGKIIVENGQPRLFKLEQAVRDHCTNATEMWSSPKAEEVPVDFVADGGRHIDITGNFCRNILSGEPLMAPGDEGLLAVELINAIILSSKTGKPVDLPVDRAAYDRQLAKLKRSSADKKNLREQRVTDTHYTGK